MRGTDIRVRQRAALPVVACLTAACAMEIAAPIQAPPDTWDPARNTHPAAAAFQDVLDRYVQRGLPGVVLFVRSPAGVWNGASGYAKLETDEPMLPTHRHHAASVTKMYTAATVLLLVEDGVIDLDARISAYLPDTIWRPIPNGGEATVRQLLCHRSGIPDFDWALAYDLDALNDPLGEMPTERLLSYLHGQPAASTPGTGYSYSNANYVLLALIVDHVARGSHADVVTERILQPLELRGTYYKNEPGYPAPVGLVNSYEDLVGNGRLMNVTDLATHAAQWASGNAGMIATSADFAAFLDALLGGQVVGPELVTEMLTWPEGSRYGLGVQYVETPYGRGIGHTGGDTGVLAQVRHFPDAEATIVLLANAGDNGVMSDLFFALWDDVLDAALRAHS